MRRASLNHTYRIVWSDVHNAWIAVAEKSKAHRKGGRVKAVVAAVAAAIGIMSGGPVAYAACTNINITAASTVFGPVPLGGPDCSVTNSGTILGSSSPGVLASGISTTGGVTNSGLITSTNTGAGAISLWSSSVAGNITNSGVITGASGIALFNSTISGDITNSATGAITGTKSTGAGIALWSGSSVGSITNSGVITGASGIHLYFSSSAINGAIVNNVGGVISGTASSGAGIRIASGGTVGSISNSGLISGGSFAIGLMSGTTVGSITNDGVITGASGISLQGGTVSGSIVNNVGGTITGTSVAGIGIYNSSTVGGGITNSGTISGYNAGINLNNSGTINGNIVNNVGGVISGSGTGSSWAAGINIDGSTVNGNIVNNGVISGINGSTSVAGIWIGNSSTVTGSIANSGMISGSSYGIWIGSNSKVSGGINNSGTISGGFTGITVASGSTVSGGITNTGTLTGGVNIGSGAVVSGGLDLQNGVSVNNNGTISLPTGTSTISGNYSQGSSGILETNVASSTNYGQLAVTGTASMSGGVNVLLSQGSGITNGGTITGVVTASSLNAGALTVTDNSLLLDFTASVVGNSLDLTAFSNPDPNYCGATVSGTVMGPCKIGFDAPSITNNGTIQGASTGVLALGGNYTGSITNNGLVTGSSTGVRLAGANITGDISNSGIISGGNKGIALWSGSSISSISNSASGTISGSSVGIAVSTSSTVGSIDNSGVISGASGISLRSGSSVSGSIVNNVGGTISGTSVAGIGVHSGSMAGSITNSGQISGNSAGIMFTSGSTATSITNGGVISGASGISLYNSSQVTGAIVNNAGGTINGTSSAGIGVHTGSTVGSVTNNGQISGSSVGIKLTSGSMAGSVTNSGQISGNAAGMMLTSGSTVGSITNGGVISGASGISLYSSSNVSGAIVNNVGGTITGTSVAGIGIYSSTVGSIDNSGTISGYNAGINLNNSGTINGNIVNNVGGVIAGSGSGTNWAAGINIDFSTVNGNIVNNGVISGTNGSTSVAGIWIGASSTVTGSINNTGTISGGSTGIAVWSGSTVGNIINSGTISGGTNGIAVTSGSSVGSIANSGTISGSSYAVFVDGSSTVSNINISGSSASFIGDVSAPNTNVTVNTGAIFANDNAFDVNSFTVASGGTFNMGAGTNLSVANPGVTVSSGFSNSGTVSVADGVTTSITGDYTQTSTGVLQVGASSSTSYGQLAVSGTATLSPSANLAVDVAGVNTLAKNDVLAGVLTAGTLNASTFSVSDNSSLFNFTATINGNAIDLTTTSGITATQSAGSNPALKGIAKVIDGIIDGSIPSTGTASLITEFGKLGTSKQVADALFQLVPLLEGSTDYAVQNVLSDIKQIIAYERGGASSGDPYLTDKAAWIKPFGSKAQQGDLDSVPGYTANTGGLVLGVDGDVPGGNRLGVALALAKTSLDSESSASQTADINTTQVIVYGNHKLSGTDSLDYQVGIGKHSNKGERSIPLMGLKASSSFSSLSLHAGGAWKRDIALDDGSTLTPTLTADYTTVRDDSYTETGAGVLNLKVDSRSTSQFIIGGGGKYSHDMNETTKFTANLGIGFDLINEQASVTSALAGSPTASFTTDGLKRSAVVGTGGLGIEHNTSSGVNLVGRYDVEARSGLTNQSVSAKLRWKF